MLMVAGFVTVCLWGAPAAVSEPGGAATEPVASNQSQTPETVVFDLHYRALTGSDDPLSYHSFWGFGSNPPQGVAFVDAVKAQVQKSDDVFNGAMPRAQQWSIVEVKGKKPVALYFDLDGDGKLGDGERILPTVPSQPQPGQEFVFVTPDFVMRRDDGSEIPFRVMLVANLYGGDRLNYMWSPCCVLEGQATFAGEPMRLFLFGNGFTGSFSTFGRCSFSLVPANQKLPEYPPRNTLSGLICHDGAFYRLSLDGSHEKGKTLQVKLRKDTSPTGQVAIRLKGKEPVKTRLAWATITGGKDDSIQFSTGNAQSIIPVGQYQLASGNVCYGVQSDDQWQISFGEGPNFTVVKDQTATVEIGELTLTIKAVDEGERYRSDVKEKTTYGRGTKIYLTPVIKGKVGEVYTRFSQKQADGNQWTDVKPHVAILNASGKEVASADMEYG